MEEKDGWDNPPPLPRRMTKKEIAESEREYFGKRHHRTDYKSNYVSPRVLQAGASRGKTMVPMKKILSVANTSVIDVGAAYQMGQTFLADTEGDILYKKIEMSLDATEYPLAKVLEIAKKPLNKEARAFQNGAEHFVTINGDYGTSPILMWVNYNAEMRRGRRRIKNIDAADVSFEIMTHPGALELYTAYLERELETEKLSKIKWWTQSNHGPNTREIFLPPTDTVILPEFYPDITPNPSQFIEDYLNSDKSILLLAGAPGTGKTTLLRHMILEHKLNAHVIYDEELMKNDTVFQNFLFDESDEIMIIEDADTILSDRERDGNKLMSRFLNVSDGLIKLPNKKIVFTTNLSDFGMVDKALMRPGRCFGAVHTRALNLAEAQAAAKAANLSVPMDKREYTIAELFNQGKAQKVRGVGFIAA